MISGVLQLAERPIRNLMTVRADVDTIDLATTPRRFVQN
jgi:CBS domain containing-hemolysin-like protein